MKYGVNSRWKFWKKETQYGILDTIFVRNQSIVKIDIYTVVSNFNSRTAYVKVYKFVRVSKCYMHRKIHHLPRNDTTLRSDSSRLTIVPFPLHPISRIPFSYCHPITHHSKWQEFGSLLWSITIVRTGRCSEAINRIF